MIPWNLAIDIFVLNVQELIYGWRIFDYISFQSFKFTTRENRWMLNSKVMDESIRQEMQTLDLMCFSSQYFFILAFFAMGMLSNIFAITIFLRFEFNFLGDPLMPLIILIMFLVCEILRFGIIQIANIKIKRLDWNGLWAVEIIEGKMCFCYVHKKFVIDIF